MAELGTQHLITFCGNCKCGSNCKCGNCQCPELFVDHDAAPERRIMITDDFGQRIQMSVEQLRAIVDDAREGRITSLVDAELAVGAF
jgi:hypothetical protein